MHQDVEVQYYYLDIAQLLHPQDYQLKPYKQACGNSFLWVFTNQPPNALSINFPSCEGCDYENLLLSPIPHCKNNKFRPQDIIIGASRAFTHYPIDHITVVDCE